MRKNRKVFKVVDKQAGVNERSESESEINRIDRKKTGRRARKTRVAKHAHNTLINHIHTWILRHVPVIVSAVPISRVIMTTTTTPAYRSSTKGRASTTTRRASSFAVTPFPPTAFT